MLSNFILGLGRIHPERRRARWRIRVGYREKADERDGPRKAGPADQRLRAGLTDYPPHHEVGHG